jgi:hypothetical protein
MVLMTKDNVPLPPLLLLLLLLLQNNTKGAVLAERAVAELYWSILHHTQTAESLVGTPGPEAKCHFSPPVCREQ